MDTTRLSAWIADRATVSDDGDGLVDSLCRALVEAGLPLWRFSVSAPTIDPLHRGVSLNWYADRDFDFELNPHGTEQEAVWLRSPIHALLHRGEHAGRWRLEAADAGDAFPILRELRAQGGTDYVLRVVAFAPGTALRGAALSFTTRRPDGFAEAEIAALDALLPVLGLAMSKLILAHTLRDVLGTYLGPATADRVLDGDIQRGQGRMVPAAILLADLRAFTALSDRADPLAVAGWLNEHFDALGEPVARHGGEILKFLGDGFLATFPVPDAAAPSCAGCGAALSAAAEALTANAALNARRRAAGAPELTADLVLHYGEVVQGNVGTDRRLDFTLIGRAMNEASRIEGHCERLGRALLISDVFAARCGGALEPVGSVTLRGLASPQRVWTLPGLG
ncbi:adenylate/guanylate cyclase domain-containing protein [Methylobacterium sp. NEAU 140]|uniref:adenylate/guanylate cyclase domain-containing protein n=1 Tax=Methylobacterium sp. NEAU 140 TaxID=3064945 RepID=UPI002734445D|nr:adenylate/guanylate cyclase domain-containing protein [Methylobacterium sp. NEAU 140]MDP4023233.1 adenylate/guanylate cyclase domain-containing protein [Methylobacterium sp. NEAU 140]